MLFFNFKIKRVNLSRRNKYFLQDSAELHGEGYVIETPRAKLEDQPKNL
jgi:hypothetical protein